MAVFIILILISVGFYYLGRKNNKNLLKYIGIGLFSLSLILFIGKKIGFIKDDQGLVVNTDFASRVDIVETVAASGKIQPEVEVKISPDVSGEIVELPIKEGSQVFKGDLLASFLSSDDCLTLPLLLNSSSNKSIFEGFSGVRMF